MVVASNMRRQLMPQFRQPTSYEVRMAYRRAVEFVVPFDEASLDAQLPHPAESYEDPEELYEARQELFDRNKKKLFAKLSIDASVHPRKSGYFVEVDEKDNFVRTIPRPTKTGEVL